MHGDILEQEINEQPQALQRFLEAEVDRVEEVIGALHNAFETIVIAARGTSDNAARYAKYLFGAHNRIQVALATPSLFTLYQQAPRMQNALVIGISQSGQSPDIVSVLEEGRRQGQPTLAITNAPESPLAGVAQHVIDLHAGLERSVAATKTYTTSLAAIALLSCALSSDRQAMEQLKTLPVLVSQVLESALALKPGVKRYRTIDQCAVIGRGFNYASAFEVALKIKELCQIVAEPYSSADFLHGPIATIREGFPVVVIAPAGCVLEDMRNLVMRLEALGAELFVISNERDLLEKAHLAVALPSDLPEWLSPMAAVLPGQRFSLDLARARGLDPDQPPGLAKVTETW